VKYTNPRQLLKVNETELYDLMVRTSELLRQTADGGIDEIKELLVEGITLSHERKIGEVTVNWPTDTKARDGLHAMLCYAFTCGVAFAVDQQVKNAVKVIDKMQKN
jgi:hypothetical protein